MEMGFDHGALRVPSELGHDSPGQLERLDWRGLKARFAAAHALRRTLQDGVELQIGGSFSTDAAGILAMNRARLSDVNPNDLANGKEPDGIEANIVGAPLTDDRGLT